MFTHLIQVDELLQHRGSNWLVFDVRYNLQQPDAGRDAYLAQHIPGALYLDCHHDLAGEATGTNGRHPLPDRKAFAALMRSKGLSHRTQVVIYDDGNAMFAARLWWMLRWIGHTAVAVLDGGWHAWQQAGGAVESGQNSPRVSEAQVIQSLPLSSHVPMPTVTAQHIMENLAEPVFVVLDARAPERFRGDEEPMDRIGGHIPGALNRPMSLNLAESGQFKRPEQLQQEFQALLGDTPPQHVVNQCGSGITACHNLFAMELAGLSGSALYPGSWSEWVSDSQRPVATAE